MKDNYTKAYKEVIEILKYVPQESVDKIPKDILDMFKANMDNTYEFKVDTTKKFEEQILLEETKAILANIFRDYWATPYQKERIEAKERQDRVKLEEEKRQKYNPDNIFKIKQYNREEKETNTENKNLPIEVKKSFFEKIVEFFAHLFHLK